MTERSSGRTPQPPAIEPDAPLIGDWLHIEADGTVVVFTGKVEVGQHIRTSLAQAVAEELRLPLDAIQLVMADTDHTPYDMGTVGSRTTPIMARRLHRVAANAVTDALREEVNERGVRVLSVFLGRTASRMQEAIHREEQRPYDPARLLQPADVASMVVAALALPRTAEVTDLHIRPMLKH